jgi:hypothetical protein
MQSFPLRTVFLGIVLCAFVESRGAAQPISGIDISAKKNPGGVKTAMVTTNADGAYTLTDLAPGTYSLVFEISGDAGVPSGSQVTVTGRVSHELSGGENPGTPTKAVTGPAQFSKSLKSTATGVTITQTITIAAGMGTVTGRVVALAPTSPAPKSATGPSSVRPATSSSSTAAPASLPDGLEGEGSGSTNGKMGLTECERMCKTRCDCEAHNANCSCVIPGLPPSRN